MLKHEPRNKTFLLYGKLGDQIYAMPFVKYVGGGNLLNAHGVRFFRKQTYIKKALGAWRRNWNGKPESWEEYIKRGRKTVGADEGRLVHLLGYKVYRNQNGYRILRPKQTLVEYHFTGLRFPLPSLWELHNEMIPWLVADNDGVERDIIIHRSARYHCPGVNWNFVTGLPGKVFCVGSPAEAKVFQKIGIPWIRTNTVDDLARVINSAKLFIGNQSAPLAIATGLGKCRLIEEDGVGNPNYPHTNPLWWKNCTFGTKNEGVLTHLRSTNIQMAKALLEDGEINFDIEKAGLFAHHQHRVMWGRTRRSLKATVFI
jgi:hypothetical protein